MSSQDTSVTRPATAADRQILASALCLVLRHDSETFDEGTLFDRYGPCENNYGWSIWINGPFSDTEREVYCRLFYGYALKGKLSNFF